MKGFRQLGYARSYQVGTFLKNMPEEIRLKSSQGKLAAMVSEQLGFHVSANTLAKLARDLSIPIRRLQPKPERPQDSERLTVTERINSITGRLNAVFPEIKQRMEELDARLKKVEAFFDDGQQEPNL
jgi:hypothetical protein